MSQVPMNYCREHGINNCLDPRCLPRLTELEKKILRQPATEASSVPLNEIVRKHWFCLSFSGTSLDGNPCQACTYVGYEKKRIPKEEIERNKECAGVRDNAVLIACSYLGYMTKGQFIA